uniref:Uncharacterized protein n=1 Tax=viral metagenome TaxID=1070528 RepID=A0A6M3J7R8_9ZZZZ
MAEERWVLCPRCGKKLAKNKNGVLEIKNGNKSARIYGAVCVAIDCERCGTTLDLPHKMPVAKE